jgi:folate-binding protein YgfZ
MNSFKIYSQGRKGSFSSSRLFKVSGPDREKYLQGQTTNDILNLPINSFQLNSRVDRSGKVQSFFLIFKDTDFLYLLIDQEIASSAIEDLEKFIIMDDLEINEIENTLNFVIGNSSKSENSFKSFLFGLPAEVSLSPLGSTFEELTNEERDYLCSYFGWPVINRDVSIGQLINETRLDDLSVSYSKGCFLGQETVSKIHHGRGASYVPVRVKLDPSVNPTIGKFQIDGRKGGELLQIGNGIGLASVFREFRIENKEFTLVQESSSSNVMFEKLPETFSLDSFADDLYHFAVEQFHNDDEQSAIDLFQAVISLSPAYADAYESLGVIYGRQEKFEKGIELMDELLSVDSDSVLAHTNKSLFLMKLGKIEEAEEEKGHATFKSFAMFGKEAETKRAQEEAKKEKEEQMIQRESMFKQVLEIDEVDTIANYGMADIYFYRGEYELSRKHLDVVLKEDDKYSTAYLLLGKVLEMLNLNSEAKEIYSKGIKVASSRGELMPANEMQARLVKL